METLKKKKYTLKVYKSDGKIETVRTGKKKRFFKILRTINWQNSPIKVYLRVNYGKKLDVWGKYSTFYNDGWYENRDELWQAFHAFNEED